MLIDSVPPTLDGIALFPVPQRDFADGADFRAYLVKNFHAEDVSNELTVLVGLTKRSEGETIEALDRAGFHTARQLGAVRHLRFGEGEGAFDTYFTFEEGSGVLVFYTNFRKTEEIPQLNEFLYGDPKTYPLFFRPAVMQAIVDGLLERFPNLQIVEFTARRHPGSKQPAKIRPETRRTFSYWGADARETLSELRFLYGVLPDRAILEIPEEGKFGIDSRGFLTFYRGNLSIIFEILGRAIAESSTTVKAFDGSAFQIYPIRTANKSFDIPSSKPVHIRLHRRLEYSEVDELAGLLESEGYSVLNLSAEEGSLFLSADIVSAAGQRFRIKASESALRLLPAGDPQFQAFMEFYRFVVDSVDAQAELAT
jgi:hypothetical protein